MDGVTELISAVRVEERIRQIALQIASEEPTPPVVLGILNGAAPFMMALLRAFPGSYGAEANWDFVDASSYQGTQSSGRVEVDRLPKMPLRDRSVLLVDGIIDTGQTVEAVLTHLETLGATHVRVATLVDKPSRRKVQVPVDYVGFEVEDVFVVGYGMDFDQRYRNLPYIGVVTDE